MEKQLGGNDNFFWQGYSCGCVSPKFSTDKQLPTSCPKHGQPFLQRYISNKVTRSIGQIEDNEQPVLGITKARINGH